VGGGPFGDVEFGDPPDDAVAAAFHGTDVGAGAALVVLDQPAAAFLEKNPVGGTFLGQHLDAGGELQ